MRHQPLAVGTVWAWCLCGCLAVDLSVLLGVWWLWVLAT